MPARKQTAKLFQVIIGLALLAALILLLSKPEAAAVASAPPVAPLLAQVDDGRPTADDRACRLCHADTEAVITFPSGETLPVQVDVSTLAGSAHGLHLETPLACTDCHAPAEYQYPHNPIEADSIAEYHLARSETCLQCHQNPHPTSHPGPGSEHPVVCTDCHGAHDVVPVEEWPAEEAVTACVDCHSRLELERQDPADLVRLIENGLFEGDQTDQEYCLACHSLPNQFLVFENGDRLSVTVTAAELHDSVHGQDNPWQPLVCDDCHVNKDFPHEPIEAQSFREYRVNHYDLCARCHEPKYESTLDDTHGQALAEGNLEAAVCTDCHGAHNIPIPDQPRARISHTCEQCHNDVFNQYAISVHGEALLEESNPDVPTCIECHGVHNLTDPKTALFRIQSPQLCATCHADDELMTEYDISTDVFETYVADFHGTTVTLFEQQSPEVETNKAVCYDCHGVHAIFDPDDPHNGIKANLLETCQQCHPDATANFSDAWTSHYVPSLQNNPLVFLVNWFYRIIIPLSIGGLGFLVITDVYRRVRGR